MTDRRRGVFLCAAAIVLACRSTPAPTIAVPTFPVSYPGDTAAAQPPVAGPPPTATPPAAPPVRRDPVVSTVRVALATAARSAAVTSSGAFVVSAFSGRELVRSERGETWRVERDGPDIRFARADGVRGPTSGEPIVVRPVGASLLSIDGKRYRGEIRVHASDSGLTIVNVLTLEDYLRGVVPLEIGSSRAPAESAAVQVQAIAARSYSAVHVAMPRSTLYDMASTVLDQVYGGADAEAPVSDRAIESTRGLVIKYAGRVVNAPYSATCGGSTAEPQEVWRSPPEPYLQRVSDRIPGTDRFYCDISPRFRWTRTLTGAELDASVRAYLATYVAVPAAGVGHVRDVSVASRTESGRVGTLTLTTDRGNFTLRGNDVRWVLRTVGGEILNSTYFSVESASSGGALSRLTIRGTGYGHGIGMCQWGAIGRARAGQDFRTILGTYYPGTTVGPLD